MSNKRMRNNNWFKNIYKPDVKYRPAVGEYGDLIPEYISQSDEIAKKTGVNILRGKDLSTVAMFGDKVIGALWIEVTSDDFSFDVAVLPEYQGLGIGKKLSDIAYNEYLDFKEIYSEMGEDLFLNVSVTNPIMRRILEDKGYYVSHHIGDNYWMMTKAENE